jgi:hypothetical protein
VEEEQPAAEHEAVPAPPAGQSTEERHAIVDQPTEMYDVEEEFEPPATAATPEIDEEQDVEDEDDFFDEQRLSDELDQALEAPSENEPEPTLHPEEEPAEEEPAEDEEPAEEEPAEEQGDDDVLGGTPDFLEESPEDDELWFEQKPPKDFDFDD